MDDACELGSRRGTTHALLSLDARKMLENRPPILSPLGEAVVYEVDTDAAGDALAIVATVSEGRAAP